MPLTSDAVERWRNMYEQSMADESWVAHQTKRDHRRIQVREEMLALLQAYLTEQISSDKFKETYDRKTRREWDVFGLKGLSGAMFLNMLVKNIPDRQAASKQLRLVLGLPSDEHTGRSRLKAFIDYLGSVVGSEGLDKRRIQPAYAPFFISSWWHLQATEQWPIYYVSGRQALDQDGLFAATGNLVEDYFTFRELFTSLMSALNLTSWEMEHVLAWRTEKQAKTVEAERTRPGKAEPSVEDAETQEEPADEHNGSVHTQVQWLLAKIGKRLGCQVWIAANDQNKRWRGDRLGDYSVKALPTLGMDTDSQRVIGLIDVVWVKGANQVAAAFEIEHTTSIYSGLLRMSDLTVLSPNLNFPLYIVTGENRLDQVKRELSRPTFQSMELHKRCGYFSNEQLIAEFDSIMKWAGDPSVMDRLASKVDDTSA